MKKYIYILVALIPHAIIPCASSQSGQRAWNIATKNIFITQAIESSLDGVSSIDTIAAFSNLDLLLNRVIIVESKASLLLQEIDHLQNNLIEDASQTQQIQSDIQLIESNLALLDLSSVFTALDALQTTILSAMDFLNTDLETIVTQIDALAALEVQYFQTVASQLDKLDDDVAMVSSLLDGLGAQFSLSTFDSITDLLHQELVTLESNIDILTDQLDGGFVGTFSVLDQNMLLVQTIESMADTLDLMNNIDLTATYSLLDQLEVSVQTIDSLVDLLVDTFENIESTIDILGSALDESVSKYMFVESRTSLLVQKIEELVNNPAFSAVDHATSLLDRDISLLESAYAADLPALTNSIESKLDHIIAQQHQQISDLDTIASIFDAIANIQSGTIISKLEIANSLLDDTIDDVFATESYLDPATHSEQLFTIANNAQDLHEQLSYVDLIVPEISSKMILVDDLLATTNSTLDIIDTIAQSNVEGAIALESMIDTLSFVAQQSESVTSILDVISSQEDLVISKLALTSSLIATENSQAQDLIGDFQSTWTILQSIDTKLAQAYSSLSFADVIDSINYLPIFTVIDTIVVNESTINSQVDVYNSMVDALTHNINVDFNGVFTELDATIINVSNDITSSMLSVISSKLSIVQTELGFPIYQRDLPLTINTSGRYYFAENINFSDASGTAITINTDNVSIDLNGRTLNYAGGGASVTGILINNVDNTKIFNGTISNFTSDSIRTGTGQTTNTIMRDLVVVQGRINFSGTGRNHQFNNNFLISTSTTGLIVASGTQTNMVIDNCVGIGNAVSGRALGFQMNSGTIRNLQISNCYFKSHPSSTTLANGIGFNGSTIIPINALIQNNIILPINAPINLSSPAQDTTIIGNILSGESVGINLNPFGGSLARVIIHKNILKSGSTGITNTTNYTVASTVAITFNHLVNNTVGNIRITQGLATVLGNFAFNTNAVGNPNNTNYTMPAVTQITGKFVTISQRTGISGSTAPRYWHNINMLP